MDIKNQNRGAAKEIHWRDPLLSFPKANKRWFGTADKSDGLEFKKPGFKSVLGYGNSLGGGNSKALFEHLTYLKNPIRVNIV